VLGHRGAPREAPENTVRSFQLALDQGADGVELDVQPAGDGTAVVIHDDSLDRTTDRTGSLAGLDWAAISAARSGGEPVPRLEQAIDWAVRTGAWVNVEVKSPGVEQESVRRVREAGLLDRTVVSSFLPGVVAGLRAQGDDATCFLLTEHWNEETRAAARELGVAGVCLHDPLATPEALAWLREYRLHAGVWTVDEPTRIRALFAQGVLAVISNYPARAVAARREVFG
jgi:glycerophosphoryl diester phosphodiesterase